MDTTTDTTLWKIYTRLTPRQRETLKLVTQGFSNDAIAGVMHVQSATVADYLTDIYAEVAVYEDLADYTKRNRVAYLFRDFMEHVEP